MFTYVVVTGSWPSPTSGGPGAGRVRFQLTGDMADTTDHLTVPARAVMGWLDQYGDLAVPLAANDDATTSPPNAQYLVTVDVDSAPSEQFYVTVPHAPAGSRAVSDAVTALGSPIVSSATAAFTGGDVGKYAAGVGIPPGATIQSVQSSTHATLSAPALGTSGAGALVIGASVDLATLRP